MAKTPSRKAATKTAAKSAAKKTTTTKGPIELPELQRRVFRAYIWGDSPLIVHAWSQKARLEMLAKQMGQKLPRLPKSPVQEFLSSLYRFPDGGYGFPATALKKAMVQSCTSMNKEITKIAATQAFYIPGEPGVSASAFNNMKTPMGLIRLYSPEPPHIREDAVRLNGQTSDLRYRGEFTQWGMCVDITYNALVVTEATVAALVDTAGFAVGLGEWRQEKMGISGLFRLATPAEQKLIDKWSKLKPKEPEIPDEQAFIQDIVANVRKYGEAPDADGEAPKTKRSRSSGSSTIQ